MFDQFVETLEMFRSLDNSQNNVFTNKKIMEKSNDIYSREIITNKY